MAQGQVFSCECCEFFKNRFFYRTSLVVAFAKERGKKFQMKEENENISFKFYLQLCKCYNCSPFFSYFFFKFSFFSFLHAHFFCFHFLQTEKCLWLYLLVYSEAGIESCFVKQLFGKIEPKPLIFFIKLGSIFSTVY